MNRIEPDVMALMNTWTARFAGFLFLLAALTGRLPAAPTFAGEEGAMDKPFFKEQLIFDEIPGYPSCHGSTVTELPGGALFAAWYAGAAEKATDVAIFCSRLAPGAEKWSSPEILHDAPGLSEGNPVLFADGDGRVWFFYVVMYGSTWNDCKVHYRTSDDEGKTWSGENTLIGQKGWMTRNHPLILNDGTFILPIYNEVLFTPGFILTTDGGKTWKKTGINLRAGGGIIQPSSVQLSDGAILAYMRTGAKEGFIMKTVSTDGGEKWSSPEPTAFPNPNAAVDLARLRDGSLVLIYNDSFYDRTPLSAALSTDEGKTWTFKRDLEKTFGEFSYPSLIQSRDGVIHVTYTYKRTNIKHAAFNKEWIMQKPYKK
ncbi:MAG: sialidase family protein [bacterium]